MINNQPDKLFIPGVAVPQGSTRAYVRGGRAVTVHANSKTIPWRDTIAIHLAAHCGPGSSIDHPAGCVSVSMAFVLPRRAAEPKRSTPAHTRKPDLDKLVRAVLDAMTGLAFTDDNQVTYIAAGKRTAEPGEQPGLHLGWTSPAADTQPLHVTDPHPPAAGRPGGSGTPGPGSDPSSSRSSSPARPRRTLR